MNADWGRYQLFLRWCRPPVARLCPGIEVLQLLWRREFLEFSVCKEVADQVVFLGTHQQGLPPAPEAGLLYLWV